MKDIQIYFSEDSEIIEREIIDCKQSRSDVIIKIGDKFFKPVFETLQSISNELKNNTAIGLNYYVEMDLIIIDKIDKNSIINSVINLHDNNEFFIYATQYTKNEIEKIVLNLSSYVKVY